MGMGSPRPAMADVALVGHRLAGVVFRLIFHCHCGAWGWVILLQASMSLGACGFGRISFCHPQSIEIVAESCAVDGFGTLGLVIVSLGSRIGNDG